MSWKPVSHSSAVSGVAAEGNDLLVRFASGQTRRYAGAAELEAQLLGSPSPGSFYARHIKGRYSSEEA